LGDAIVWIQIGPKAQKEQVDRGSRRLVSESCEQRKVYDSLLYVTVWKRDMELERDSLSGLDGENSLCFDALIDRTGARTGQK